VSNLNDVEAVLGRRLGVALAEISISTFLRSVWRWWAEKLRHAEYALFDERRRQGASNFETHVSDVSAVLQLAST